MESALSVVRLRRLGSRHSFAEVSETLAANPLTCETEPEPLPGS